MTKEEALMKEISDILIKPTNWSPMLVQRARIALQQAHQTILNLDKQIKVYQRVRNHAQIERNLDIVKEFDEGATQIALSVKYRLTKQRINRIILMTRKQLENEDGPSQSEGIPRKRNRRVKKTTRARQQKDRLASSDGRREDSNRGFDH